MGIFPNRGEKKIFETTTELQMFFLSKELQAVCRNTGAKLGEASPSGGFLPRFLPGFWTYLGFFLKASETLNFGT